MSLVAQKVAQTFNEITVVIDEQKIGHLLANISSAAAAAVGTPVIADLLRPKRQLAKLSLSEGEAEGGRARERLPILFTPQG